MTDLNKLIQATQECLANINNKQIWEKWMRYIYSRPTGRRITKERCIIKENGLDCSTCPLCLNFWSNNTGGPWFLCSPPFYIEAYITITEGQATLAYIQFAACLEAIGESQRE